MNVPVKTSDGQALMPTTPSRARRLVKVGKATPYWSHGVFCIRLNFEPSARNTQEVSVGVDPGFKKEGYSVVSNKHTFLNTQSDTIRWVSDAMTSRRQMRVNRRGRNAPCRAPRMNRSSKPFISPSVRAHWSLRLRVINWLRKLYPVTSLVVEDVYADSRKGQPLWNLAFSPLMRGKTWFYEELRKLPIFLTLRKGWHTKDYRVKLGLEKSSNKLSSDFSAHCVDSWTLAVSVLERVPELDRYLIQISPLHYRRRSLHYLVPAKGGVRERHGGTRSLGFRRGSIVKHARWGVTYVGGTHEGKVSLHDLRTGKRVTQEARLPHIKFLAYNSWQSSGHGHPRVRGVKPNISAELRKAEGYAVHGQTRKKQEREASGIKTPWALRMERRAEILAKKAANPGKITAYMKRKMAKASASAPS